MLGEARTLYPDMRETLKATEVLVAEGFKPMVYCTDDPIAAKQLEEAGAVAIMPLGAPIGSGLGIQNRVTIRLIVEGAKVPVLVDAGVGTASDAAVAMELGCDGVLMNTAIAEAKDPVRMAAGDEACGRGGRDAYLAGRMGNAQVRRSLEPAGRADLKRAEPFGGGGTSPGLPRYLLCVCKARPARRILKEDIMGGGIDKVKGNVNEAIGKAKQQSNNPATRDEGAAQEVKGKAQQTSGKIKGALGDGI